MHVIRARNVNNAWYAGIQLIDREGEVQETRAGRARVVPSPVSIVYERPVERVVFDPVRDANPFFHHFEALWMLAGRDDATWLDQFVSDFSKRFAEDGGRMHGAYGKRWRGWFDQRDHSRAEALNQLNEVVRLLRENRFDRQAVIQMWDPSADLGVPGLKDRPCNQQVLLRCDRLVRFDGATDPMLQLHIDPATGMTPALDITVTCRSNDLVFGCMGANAVHFSMLHEYLAARIGVEVGTYTQFSNNLHMYEWSSAKVDQRSAYDNVSFLRPYPATRPLVDHPESFDEELLLWIEDPLHERALTFRNSHFARVAQPMFVANEYRLKKQYSVAIGYASEIAAPDWRAASVEWLGRRIKDPSPVKDTRS